MNEMDKAEAILTFDHVKISEIVEGTGVNRQSISNYKNGRNDIKKVQWDTVHKLATFYDDYVFDNATGIGMNKFIARLALWFNEAYQDEIDIANSEEAIPDDRAMAEVINEMRNILSEDKAIAARLYDVFSELLSHE